MYVTFLSEESKEVIRLLELHGYEAYIVGGAVRDFLLNKKVSDIDIATSALANEVKKIFPKTIDIGIEHGTILVLISGKPIEVTTFRTKEKYEKRSLKNDLALRDFTMNALAMTKSGELIDYFNGKKDLRNRLIRAVRSGQDRFQEDPLRMLRVFRFVSSLNFSIEDDTFEAIQSNAFLLENISVERIKKEMDRLFLGKGAHRAMTLLVESHLSKWLPAYPKSLSFIEKVLPFESEKEGWAYFVTLENIPLHTLSESYKLSNAEKHFIQQVNHLYQRLHARPLTRDDCYLYSSEVLYLANKFYCISNNLQNNHSIKYFLRKKKELPIQSMNDLAISGNDLIQWTGKKAGKWIGEWMTKIEYAVLHQYCENDTNKIEEWFLHEYETER